MMGTGGPGATRAGGEWNRDDTGAHWPASPTPTPRSGGTRASQSLRGDASPSSAALGNACWPPKPATSGHDSPGEADTRVLELQNVLREADAPLKTIAVTTVGQSVGRSVSQSVCQLGVGVVGRAPCPPSAGAAIGVHPRARAAATRRSTAAGRHERHRGEQHARPGGKPVVRFSSMRAVMPRKPMLPGTRTRMPGTCTTPRGRAAALEEVGRKADRERADGAPTSAPIVCWPSCRPPNRRARPRESRQIPRPRAEQHAESEGRQAEREIGVQGSSGGIRAERHGSGQRRDERRANRCADGQRR